MMKRKCIKILIALFVMTYGGLSFAAISSEEAAQLGKTLTLIGAQKAGNADGTIPEYTGGLKKLPAGYDPKTGKLPDPFAEEKPVLSINAKNMAQYEFKLTEGTKAVLKQHPDFRIDVYKTHRTVWYPQWVLDNTVKLATKARTANEGISLRDAHAGYPFPIPKTGMEVMWNHLVGYKGIGYTEDVDGYLVDRSGRPTATGKSITEYDFPYWDVNSNEDYVYYFIVEFSAPPRLAGQIMVVHDAVNPGEVPRKAWMYLPGQRRVKLAPEVAFDTPNLATAGVVLYDDTYMYNGSMERYDWKLLGKKEMYVPYNAYRAAFGGKKEDLMPKFLNPGSLRFELHRVWIVEAKLKPGKRHVYRTRRFYVDEDSWNILATETYDAQGNIFKVGFSAMTPFYNLGGTWNDCNIWYDMIGGLYFASMWQPGMNSVKVSDKRRSKTYYSPEAMSARGIR